jgi:hypothetical protein
MQQIGIMTKYDGPLPTPIPSMPGPKIRGARALKKAAPTPIPSSLLLNAAIHSNESIKKQRVRKQI